MFEQFTTGEIDGLANEFRALGYSLQREDGENPIVLVRVHPRRVVWRTRSRHVVYALLAMLKAEREAIHG